MKSYEELKMELASIAQLVEAFPESVKGTVFDLLIGKFLGNELPIKEKSKTTEQDASQANSSRRTKRAKRRVSAKGNQAGEAEPYVENSAGAAPKKQQGKRSTSGESFAIDRDLNLRADKSIPSFKDFIEEKVPISEGQFAAASIYYLQKVRGIEPVTLNHVYTCYAEVKRKPPTAFRQMFINTKNRQGWFEFDGDGNLRIPHRGVVFVEHDMPTARKPKKDAAPLRGSPF